MAFADHPVVRVVADPVGDDADAGAWPYTVPAVAQVLDDGLALGPGVTFLVGENGTGKSTLVEAIATAFGLNPEGGSSHGGQSTRASESPLHEAIRLQRGIGAPRWGFFLRAETMHGWYTFVEEAGVGAPEFHAMSHGESLLSLLESRFTRPGFYCLDEPEAGLSFASTLTLMSVLDQLSRTGAQVLCATHSPVLAALPGATILETGPWGLRPAVWDDLTIVRDQVAFLAAPRRYLRHLLDEA